MTAEQAIAESRRTGQTVRIPYSPTAHGELFARADDFDDSADAEVYIGDGWRVEVEANPALRVAS